jgi:hypothetical protein
VSEEFKNVLDLLVAAEVKRCERRARSGTVRCELPAGHGGLHRGCGAVWGGELLKGPEIPVSAVPGLKAALKRHRHSGGGAGEVFCSWGAQAPL